MGAVRTFSGAARLHLVVAAGLGALTSGWLFTGEHLWTVAAVAAFDWLIAGFLHRVERKEMRVLALVVMSASFGLFHAYEPTLTLVRVCFFLLVLLYELPVLPGRVRLKQIYIVRNVAMALSVLLTCYFYPLARANWGFLGLPTGVEGMTLLILGTALFLFAFGFQIVHDLAEIKSDAAAGHESFPVVLGPELSATLASQLFAFTAAGLLVGYATHFVPWRALVFGFGLVLMLLLHRRAVKRGLRGADPVVLTWVVSALLAAYHGWIALRLPGILA